LKRTGHAVPFTVAGVGAGLSGRGGCLLRVRDGGEADGGCEQRGEEEYGWFHELILHQRSIRRVRRPLKKTEIALREPILYTEHVTITTERRYEIRDITELVERVLEASGLDDGTILVSTMHITSSIFVNDHEPGLWQDTMTWLESLAPRRQEYLHHRTGEDNADAHLKRMLLGHQVLVPVTRGRLDFGPWERVHYGEFDGQRPKRILLKALGFSPDR
jgi:secondary thiamine-phosphate synthase enzyme